MPRPGLTKEVRALRRTFAARGIAVVEPALGDRAFTRLLREARRKRAGARAGGRGSPVPQQNARGRLGVAGRTFLSAASTVRLMSAIAGRAVEPALNASCYTYYDRANHFCGVHRDRPDACYFTLLLCLHASWRGPTPGPGLTLEVFGSRYAPQMKPHLSLPSSANNLILMRGSRLYHGRPRLARGERAIVLTACFRLSES